MAHCHTLLDNLRQQGLRITPQRELIIQAMVHSDCHLSAEEIYASLQQHTHVINLATVYRTLEMLVEKGLASRLDLGGGRVVYATRQHGPHVHLVCRGCHKVIDAEQSMLTSLAQDLLARYGFTADLQHISIVGLCAACQAKT